MARDTGPKCKLCRREGEKLYLKGSRCFSEKCAFERRPYPPGEHGQGRTQIKEYGLQLREKQKIRRIYGLQENKSRRYFEMAEAMPGVTGENFIQLLERRLDNVIFRLGLATSRNEARQIVLHGHVYVNGKRVNIPSYQVDVGDRIRLKEASRKSKKFKEIIEYNAELNSPEWLTVNLEKAEGEVVSLPGLDDIDFPVQEHLIIEYYSR